MTESLIAQAKLAHRRGDLKHALELSEKALAQSSAEFSPRDCHELWVVKSHCLHALGRWEEALLALESAGQADELDAGAAARLVMHRGYLMGSLARYSECWSLLNQAEQAARELGFQTLLAEVLWRRGMVSIFVGEHASAESCLHSALDIATAEENFHLRGLATAGLGKNLMYCERYTEAISRFHEALGTFQEIDLPFYCAITRGELGNCHMRLGELDRALEMFQITECAFWESGALPCYQVCLADIGGVYLCRGEFLTAISYYQRALDLARQLGDELSIAKWLRNLAQAYSYLGNPALAQGFESEAKRVNGQLAAERQHAAASFK